MTIWDYSTDLEVVLVNFDWWNELEEDVRVIVQQVADASVDYQAELLQKNTLLLREKIVKANLQLYYIDPEDKLEFKQAVEPVWEKYAKLFGSAFTKSFLEELEKY
jgi:TRAP-type C4-dicarboxylate transport system substrate-binding protein